MPHEAVSLQLLLCANRQEAKREAAFEPLLSSFLYASILAHDSFEQSLAFVLAERLQNTILLASVLFDTFYGVLTSDPDVVDGALTDMEACKQRVGDRPGTHGFLSCQ